MKTLTGYSISEVMNVFAYVDFHGLNAKEAKLKTTICERTFSFELTKKNKLDGTTKYIYSLWLYDVNKPIIQFELNGDDNNFITYFPNNRIWKKICCNRFLARKKLIQR